MLGKRGVLKVWRGYDGMDLGYKQEGKMVYGRIGSSVL